MFGVVKRDGTTTDFNLTKIRYNPYILMIYQRYINFNSFIKKYYKNTPVFWKSFTKLNNLKKLEFG